MPEHIHTFDIGKIDRVIGALKAVNQFAQSPEVVRLPPAEFILRNTSRSITSMA